MIIDPYRSSEVNPDWSLVVLALHCDGTNGSTTFTDEKSHTITRVGSNVISTAQSKFGGSSIYFPGDGGIYAQTGSPATDFTWGTGDFTIRLWAYLTGATGTGRVIYDGRRNPGSAEGFIFYTDENNFLNFYWGTAFLFTDTVAFPSNQWVHLALSRVVNPSGSGFCKIFQNGVQIKSFAFGSGADLTDGRLWIGQSSTEYGSGGGWEGYMDDIEFVKGQGLYTSNFTPPTAPFPNS